MKDLIPLQCPSCAGHVDPITLTCRSCGLQFRMKSDGTLVKLEVSDVKCEKCVKSPLRIRKVLGIFRLFINMFRFFPASQMALV